MTPKKPDSASEALREESYRQTRYPAVSAKSAKSLFYRPWRDNARTHDIGFDR
jgi:hypothetical protein